MSPIGISDSIYIIRMDTVFPEVIPECKRIGKLVDRVFDHVAVFGAEGGGAGVQIDVVQTLI
jgi:hypothetical protein